MKDHSNGLMDILAHSIHKKEELFQHHYAKYAMRCVLASLYLAIGNAIAYAAGDKAEHIAHGSGKFLYAFLFGWALIMIIYMNAELGTSNMMYMTVAVKNKILSAPLAIKMLLTCLLFNLIGGIVIAYFLSLTTPFTAMDDHHMLITAVSSKLAKTPLQQVIEGSFANIIVNTAVYSALRMKDDGGKLYAIHFIIFIFSFLGFEHVIANFSSFPLAIFSNAAAIEGLSVSSVLSNFLFSGIGNFIGGGLCIGLLYSWLNTNTQIYRD